MKRAVLEMNVPLESAVRAASENPAKSIGIDNDYGSLAAGRYGNVILADKKLNIQLSTRKEPVSYEPREPDLAAADRRRADERLPERDAPGFSCRMS